MAAYFNEPDHTAHAHGPNSTEVRFTSINIGRFTETVLIRAFSYSP